MKRTRASIAADGGSLDAIIESHLSRLNDWLLNVTAFPVGHTVKQSFSTLFGKIVGTILFNQNFIRPTK